MKAENVTRAGNVHRLREVCNPLRDSGSQRPGPGLVSLSTSDTVGVVRIDRREGRLRRMRRSVMTAARLISSYGGAGRVPVMVTLTYRPGVEWEPGHISRSLKALREWARRRRVVIPKVWVAELQSRGAVHYHVLLWLPRCLRIPMPDRRGWWPHGMTRVEFVRRSAVSYVAKYCSKCGVEGLELPRGCRMHGAGGLGELAGLRRWWMLPAEVRAACVPGHDVRRARGGGWVSRWSGEWQPSAWCLSGVSRNGVSVVRVGAIRPWAGVPPDVVPGGGL